MNPTNTTPNSLPKAKTKLGKQLMALAVEAYSTEAGAAIQQQRLEAEKKAKALETAKTKALKNGLLNLGVFNHDTLFSHLTEGDQPSSIFIEPFWFEVLGDSPDALTFCVTEKVEGLGLIHQECPSLFYLGHWISEGREIALNEARERQQHQTGEEADERPRFYSPEERLVYALKDVIREAVRRHINPTD